MLAGYMEQTDISAEAREEGRTGSKKVKGLA